MTWTFKKKPKASQPDTGLRIFMWPFVLCSIAILIGLTAPLEDLYHGGRDYFRSRPFDQKAVVVAIDDRTAQRFNTTYYSRKYDAVLLDRAFANGAKRIYFDEAFGLPLDNEGDDIFAAALKRYSKNVHVGSTEFTHVISGETIRLVPIDKFKSLTQARTMHAKMTPFALSALVVYSDEIDGQLVPSISADMAGRNGKPNTYYRPDWSIRANTVPVISLVDVIDNRIPKDFFQGKDVIVGVTAQTEKDFAQIVGQGWIPGVYVHVIGAQTLREGNPHDIGGFPALLVAAIFSLALLGAKSRRSARAVLLASVVTAACAPFILDAMFIDASYLPAFAMLATVAFRTNAKRSLAEASLRNARTLLPNLSALREEQSATGRPIIAMRIRNYAAVCASFPEAVEEDLIKELSRRLTMPGTNTVFYQAEEVLYWLGTTLSHKEIEEHLAGLAQLIESHLIIQGRKLDIHVVFGVDTALERPIANRIGRALLAADQAAAKHQLVQFNTNDNDEESVWELSLMSELDEAMENGDVWVAYQPQFDLSNDRIIGAEALVRWQHPTRGAISPEAFVLAAESHNRITRLTHYVLEHALEAALPIIVRDPTFRLSVNISAILLENPKLPQQIAAKLVRSGFPAGNLTLEVTESAPFSEHAVVAQNLAQIAALGIELAIDDYGTGNATLDYIRSVPCKEIKIDRRFVTNLGSNPSDMLLVESTIELAHGLGRRVIAEGIEDPETLELLRTIHCDIAQGYYLAKPMRIEALTTLLVSSARQFAA